MTPQSFVTAVHAMEPSMPIALLALNAFELRELDRASTRRSRST